MHYYRLCETKNDKGKLIPVTEDVYKHIRSTDIDYYRSIYLFNDQQYKEFQERGSVAGMKDVVTNKLAWDFDNKQHPESAKHDAKKLIENLKSNGIQEESIQVFFSGSKGFEVSVELNNV
jgi:hypothetical protein